MMLLRLIIMASHTRFLTVPLAKDPHQQSARADHEGDPATNPRGGRIPRRPVVSQSGRGAAALHRRHRLVGQMLHEYAAALSATRLPNRGRRLTNVRKILDTTTFEHFLRKWLQNSARDQEALQRRRIDEVVFAGDPGKAVA